MKYLISTTGSAFPFMLNAKKNFMFDPIIPTEVEDGDMPILIKRLGLNIQEVSPSAQVTPPIVPPKTITSTSTVVMDADEDGEPQDVDEDE